MQILKDANRRAGWKMCAAMVVFFFLFSIQVCFSADDPPLLQAPMNPRFVEHVQAKEAGAALEAAGPFQFGYVPSPVDLSHLTGRTVQSDGIQQLGYPVSYDLRSIGKVTPVKDQGSCGDCWAFATFGAMESDLLPTQPSDFSENNLKNTHGFDWGACGGGNVFISMAYLSRWSGPVNEADDPYNPVSATSPAGLQPRKHVQNVYIVPDRASATDNDNIKYALMNYGAVYTSMYMNNAYFNPTTNAYYYSAATSSNHAVTIVGWDDNFSGSKFSPACPHNGAFIIKNSWGTAWGESGYFYVSYYDANIGRENAVFMDAEPLTNYVNNYQYDPYGWVSSVGYGSTTAWAANIFTAVAPENIAAVGFYATDMHASYGIYIYRNVTTSPTSGTLVSSASGTLAYAGYYTIPLLQTVSVNAGDRFSVVVEMANPQYAYPIAFEYPYPGYDSYATASAGQSYLSTNGSSWMDITTWKANSNVAIKAFTTNRCTYAINPIISDIFASGGGTGVIAVITQSGCNWSVSNNVDWVVIDSGGSGTGNGTVIYSVFANSSATPRSGSFTVAGATYTLQQNGTGCSYSLSPTIGAPTSGSGGTGSFTVMTQTGCNWTVSENLDWLTITSGTSGTANGTVQYSVLENPRTFSRNGTISINSFVYLAQQSGNPKVARIGVFRNGTWYLDNPGTFAWVGCGALADQTKDTCAPWGMPGDVPVMGDWNGSGTKKIGVFRNGWWYLDYPGTGTWVGCGAPADPTKDACIPWGIPGDVPVVGDWNSSGQAKIGVFRNGMWYLDYAGTGTWVGCGAPADPTKDACIPWGIPSDVPVVGDWNGSGKAKIGVFRNGMWYLDYPGTGAWVGCGAPADPTKDACMPWGILGDVPIVGDWNGSGQAKIGVLRNGWWYLDYPGTGTWVGCGAPADLTKDACIPWGIAGDTPIVE